MDEQVRQFLEQHRSAAMITTKADGRPHAVRVGVGLVDGRLWSSGTQSRVRTRHLRRDPRATLFVFDDSNTARWVGLETNVTLIEGPDAPERNLEFFRVLQRHMADQLEPGHLMWFGEQRTEEEFLQLMRDEGRLLYEFEVVRSYGMF